MHNPETSKWNIWREHGYLTKYSNPSRIIKESISIKASIDEQEQEIKEIVNQFGEFQKIKAYKVNDIIEKIKVFRKSAVSDVSDEKVITNQ